MKVDHLVFGCHNLTGGSSYKRSLNLISCALDLGIKRFDVAPSYGLGTAEAVLSSALGKRRHDPSIEIVSKFGILPPRWGWAAAQIREPYRWLRPARPAEVQSVPPQPTLRTGSEYPYDARTALERSLRALRIERLSIFLSHELLSENNIADFADAMQKLKCEGLIGRAGCSGHIDNVATMLKAAGPVAEIAQTSILDADSLICGAEVRSFNLKQLSTPNTRSTTAE